MRFPWRLVLASVLALPLGCGAVDGPGDAIMLHTAEYSADSVQFRFDVGRVSGAWAWTIDLDTDQITNANGKKTGYGDFGAEFRLRSTEQVADSIAVRPTSGPVDPAPAAGGWPLPAGYGRLDASATVSIAIPKTVLADDGLLGYKILLYDPNGLGFYDVKQGVTTPRPGSLPAVPSAGSAHAARAVRPRARG